MKKGKVKRYEIGGDVEDNYARNENREGRESTLDPSDREDAERGRRMTGTFGQVEYPNRIREAAEAAGTTGEDTGVGLLSGVTRPVKPAVRPSVRPAVKPPVAPARPMPPMSAGPAPEKPAAPVKPAPAATAAPARVGRAGQAAAAADVARPPAATTRKNKERESEGFLSRLKRGLTGGGYEFEGGGREFGRKAGGAIGYKKGGSVGSASKRADGIAIRGKTRGKMV